MIIKIYFYEIEDAILLAIHPILNQKIYHNSNKKKRNYPLLITELYLQFFVQNFLEFVNFVKHL